MSDAENSDDDFESASEGEQERDVSGSGIVPPQMAIVQEPIRQPVVNQNTMIITKTPPQPTSQKPQQAQQQVLQQRQKLQPSMKLGSYHNTEKNASPPLNDFASKERIATNTMMHSSLAAPDASTTHTPIHVQEHSLPQKRMDESQGLASRPSSTPSNLRQFSATGSPVPTLSPTLAHKPPIAPLFSGTQQQYQPSRSQQQQQQFSRPDLSQTPPSNQRQNGPQQSDPSFQGRGRQQQEEAGRGWGSLGSWINTAVSTVSEVIENPNVVVSKAQTISQGIRNVANEQIDRVYESLDPEYEYQRERQKQQQQPSYQAQQPPNNKDSGHSFTFQSKQELRRDDISDLLQSSSSPKLSSQSLPSTTANINKSDVSYTSSLQGKLAINDDAIDSSADAWGDDAWGNDWDDQPIVDKTDHSIEPLPTIKQSTVLIQPDISQPSDTIQEMQGISSQHQQLDSQQDAPRPSSKSDIPPSEPSRNVKDLFGSPRPSTFTPTQGTRGSNLTIPESVDSYLADMPLQRRPSADLRPAEALFSTLDFASNAIGSAVLGVHRKVTQAGQTQQQKNNNLEFQQIRSSNPAWGTPQRRESNDSGKEISEKMDRLGLTNPTLESVGGNVVSTGLGALEILGKRAVDVISDVRRAGHLSQGNSGNSEIFDEQNSFKIPPRMNVANLFEESGGKSHLASLRSIASAASKRVDVITTSRPDFLNAGQLDDLEQLFDTYALDSAVEELTVDLLAGHKDFRAMVALLEQMDVHGTGHLRQLRNCTRKLSTLVPDNVNAFEQEWHNHQTRASEKDFFARGPIKKFFETGLLTVYFDGLRALVQFTDKTCDQILRLAENFNIRVAEKSSNPNSSSTDNANTIGLTTLSLSKTLQQLIGSLIAETKFISKRYQESLDAILQKAKGFTTPLDNLDWEDLAMGLDKVKILLMETETVEAVGLIHSGAHCVLEVLRNDLMLDLAFGKVLPSPRKPRSRPAMKASPKPGHAVPASRSSNRPSSSSASLVISGAQSATQPSPRISPSSRMSPSPRIIPLNRLSPSPSLKPSPGPQAGQSSPSLSPSIRSATIVTSQSGQSRSSSSPLLRPMRQMNNTQTGSSRLGISSSSPLLGPTQPLGQQARHPMIAAQPKTPVSQSLASDRNLPAPGGEHGMNTQKNTSTDTSTDTNPYSYSLYPRPPPVQRPPVKEEEDFFSILNEA
ncbi:hypothetical protein FBU30_001693 [Linnemannia zychae]|nr:hypothetical protein FBU30_001693 [Linnemannia zychae]